MQLQVGDPAPLFTLFDTNKKEVGLADFENKTVLLLFFPLAFTGVCTDELCHIRDHFKDYEQLDCEVIALSVDSLFSLEKFKQENNYNFTLLSDFNREVSRAYGALYENFVLGMQGVSKRASFVIDKKGVIRYAEVLENAGDLPNFTDINKAIESTN